MTNSLKRFFIFFFLNVVIQIRAYIYIFALFALNAPYLGEAMRRV